ncbi:MAG: VTT domain-containing protein [Amphiplicatus sp.]
MMQETSNIDEAAADKEASKPAKRGLGRFLPLLLIAGAAALYFATGAHRYLSFEALKQNHSALEAFVAENFVFALVAYMLVYIAATALSLPGATLLSLLGGFLFGTLAGLGAVVIAATLGATIIFLAARTALGDFFRARAAGFIKKMEAGFNKNAFSYLLLLRLIPVFPFFIVNVVPAFTRIRVSTYMLATFIGVIPGAFAFVSAGNGLGAVLERGGEVNLKGLLLQPEVITPIVALSLLALLPIVMKIFHRPLAAAPK